MERLGKKAQRMIGSQIKTQKQLLPDLEDLYEQFADREAARNRFTHKHTEATRETPDLAAISELAIQLAAAPPDIDSLELLAETLKPITGAAAVTINTYDPRLSTLTTRYVAADAQMLPKIDRVLGRSLVGLQTPVSPQIYSEMLVQVIRIEEDLSVASFGAIPPPVAAAVRAALGIDHFAGLALIHGEELMGTVVIAMPTGQPSLPVKTLYVLAHLAAASLRRRQAEEALRDSEELYRMLVETSPDGISLMDLDSNILTANRELVRLSGYDRAEELIGKKGLAFITPEERGAAVDKLAEFLDCGVLRDHDYRLIRKDGSILPAEISLSLVKDAHNRPKAMIGVVRDITERKELEAAVQERMEELERAQARLIDSAKMAAVGELAAGVAHELNNPLTVILGFSELLLERSDKDHSDRPRLQAIARQAIRIRDTVANLLSFSRQTFFQRERADVNKVLSEALALIRLRLKASGIVIREHYAADLPLLLLDSGRMKQVFLNLFTNALQAMPSGGTLTVCSERVEDLVAIRITDTGEGIASRVRPRIFEPFFTTKPVGDGSGLGLTVSLGIVEKHNGSIQVETTEGKGSTFTVWLPIEDEETGPG